MTVAMVMVPRSPHHAFDAANNAPGDTTDNAANGTPMPDQSKYLARQAFLTSRTNFYLSFPMLFLMGAASHYPMFGK